MGYTIPEGVDTMLDVVGVGWPNVDEDAYRDMADALREFADDADDDAGTAHGHIQRLLSTGQSESLTALDKHWKKVQGKNKDLAGAARIIAGALDRVADIIVARKIAAVGELADLCATIGIALAAAPFTAGLTALLAGGKIVATRIAFKKILKEMAEAAVAEITATLTQPAVAALESIVTDLAIQTAMDVTGADDSTQLNSAGGGGSGGAGGTLGIDHDAHGNTGGKLAGVQISMNGRAKGKIDKAKGHHGRAKGKDSLTAVLDGTIEGVVEKLIKGHNHLGNHLGKKLPDALGQSSKTHRNTDKDIDDRLKKITGSGKRDDDDLTRKRTNPSDPARKHPDDVRTKPNSLNGAQLNARANSIPPSKRTCETDPVDVASGEMQLAQTDLSLPGVLPLVLSRTHLSGYRYGHWFGRSWASTLDERIELDPRGRSALWARDDGTVLLYPRLPAPDDTEGVLPLEGEQLPLTHAGVAGDVTTYAVTDPQSGLVRSFSGSPYHASTAYWLTEVEDRQGNGITLHRTPDGAPTRVVHDGGYQVALTTRNGRITDFSLRTPDGPVTVLTYGYDHDGNLDAVTNSSGLPLRFGYDTDARMTSWTDRNDSTYRYAYDPAGRVTRTVGPDGYLSSSFTYETVPDSTDTVTRFTDSTGATTVYRVDERLLITAVTAPSGQTTVQTWDEHDRLVSRTDGFGATTAWRWDEHGNLTAVREADGSVTVAEYDARSMPTRTTGPDGAVWRHSYDDAGNNDAILAPDGATTRFAHDARGAVVAVTDATGAVERLTPNAAGLPVAHEDPLGGVHTVERDAFGRPVRITDPLGAVTLLEWTVEGLPAGRTEPDGTVRAWTYDGEGNCLSETADGGGTTRFEYGHFDLLTARTDPGGARYEFRYDTERRLTQVANSAGQTWTYDYDRTGRVVAETDFHGRTLTYAYGADGRTVSRTNPLGQTVTQHLDVMGRLVAKDVDGEVTSFVHDRAGRLVGARSPHSTTVLERDAAGRLVAETVDDRTVRYSYDPEGRCTGRVTPSGVITEGTYDPAGNRTRVEVAGRPVTFAHDARGQEVSRSFGTADRPIVLSTSWDGRGRVTEQSLTARGTTLRSRAYAYDGGHRLRSVTERTTGLSRHYRLDADGRPLGVDAQGWSERYQYDGEGNQTDATWPDRAPHTDARGPRTHDGGRLLTAGAVSYTYDAAGRTVERRRKRLSRKPEVWQYAWDAEDRLVSCTTPDGTVWTYAYDAFARRTAKRRHGSDGSVVEETVFSWDGGRLAEQTDSITNTTLTWEYDGMRPIAQAEARARPGVDRAGSAAQPGSQDTDTRFFAIVTDLIGTPTELVDENGSIAWHSQSTAWGITSWNRDAIAHTPLRFPGQYADPETGLHYNHFRHYDPEAGQYTTPDPLGLDPAPNPVGYVENPATGADPMGLAPCMQQLEDMAVQINNLKPEGRARNSQTVAIIHADTPKGPVTFVASNSKAKLTDDQVKLAQKLGLIPIPDDSYIKVPPGKKGGHAEQNILNYLSRLNDGKAKPTWLPTHGGASKVVCADFCAPVIRGSGGAMYGLVHPGTQGTKQRQFYWPDRHSP